MGDKVTENMKYSYLALWLAISLNGTFISGQDMNWEVLSFSNIVEFEMPDNYTVDSASNFTTFKSELDYQTLTAAQMDLGKIKISNSNMLNELYDSQAQELKDIFNLDTINQENIEFNGLTARKVHSVRKFEGGSDQIVNALLIAVDNKFFAFTSSLFEDENELNTQKRFFEHIKYTEIKGHDKQYNAAFFESLNYRALGRLVGLLFAGIIGFLIYFFSRRKKKTTI